MVREDIMDLRPNESLEEFIVRLGECKDFYGLTWDDIAQKINIAFNLHKSESAYRKWFNRNRNCMDTGCAKEFVGGFDCDVNLPSESDEYMDIYKERVRLADERAQNNAILRRISREDTLRDIAIETAKTMSKKPLLIDHIPEIKDSKYSSEGILLLSDFHYGIDITNHFNKYNTEICKKRLAKLLSEVIIRCGWHKVKKLYVMNLGDLISGRIHAQIRMQNRIDVVTQTIEVSEILSEFLTELSKEMLIEFYSCSDNHSRIEPIKENSLGIEQLSAITPWYLQARLSDNENISIKNNVFGQDIITFNTKYHSIAGVHGNKDKLSNVQKNLTSFTQQRFDLICTAHLHHHYCDEQNMTDIICNGSVMGVDDYAQSLRLSSKPSQTLVISTENNVRDTVYKILLD